METLHEWLARFGFPSAAGAFALWIVVRLVRMRRLAGDGPSFLRRLRSRYPHRERARVHEEFEVECRPCDSLSWGRLRARAEERGLELRLRAPVGLGWPGRGWRTLIPWTELRFSRARRMGRGFVLLRAAGCDPGELWMDEESGLRLARASGGWWPAMGLRRELEHGVEREWRGPTTALLAAVGVVAAWFCAASLGVLTEWPRQREFSRNHVARTGEVVGVPSGRGRGDVTVAYTSAGHAGTLVLPRCAITDPRLGQRVTVYVGVLDPARAAVTKPRDPFATRFPLLVLTLVVLPALVAATARRRGLVVRRSVAPDPPHERAAHAAPAPESSRGAWILSLGELAPAAPALLAVGVVLALLLAHGPAPCPRGQVRLGAPVAAVEPFAGWRPAGADRGR